MSSDLCWAPANRNMKDLSDAIKFVLRKRFSGHVEGVLSKGDLPYLEGLRDAGIDGAEQLMEAILKYDDVFVQERY